MNIFLWVLQILLALHTLMGAFWKFLNTEQAVSSLNTIPHSAWLAIAIVEIICSIGLVLPFLKKPLYKLIPLSALVIALEMIFFCVVHLSSGDENKGPIIYWSVVAIVSLFVAFGRLKLKPLT